MEEHLLEHHRHQSLEVGLPPRPVESKLLLPKQFWVNSQVPRSELEERPKPRLPVRVIHC